MDRPNGGTRIPGRRSGPDLTDLGTVGGGNGLDDLREHGSGIVTTQSGGVAPVHHCEVQAAIEPAVGVADELGVGGQSGSHREAPFGGHRG